MFEKLIEVVVELIDIFMIWVGYLGLRITFLPKKTVEEDILIRTRRVIGIICLSYGCLPKHLFENLSILIIFMIILAYYLDFKDPKSNVSKSKKKSVKTSVVQITWDMWIITTVCFCFAIYHIIKF